MKFYRSLLIVLALGLVALIAVPAPAADPARTEQIGMLIEKMGSGDFDEREKATQDLDAIGAPALDLLHKASTSEDAEVRMRAEELVAKIEKRLQSVQFLVPTKVHLVYKQTPLTEAVEDFAKKSGYPIGLFDPQAKLKGRKITLDTGKVTFWAAFDLFCAKAGIVEASFDDIMRLQPPPQPQGGPLPGNGPGGFALPPVPVPPPLPLPPAKPPVQEKPRPNPEKKPQPPEQQVEAPMPPQGRPPIAIGRIQGRNAVPGQPPMGLQPGFPGQPGFGFPGMPVMPPANQITLVEGKPQAQPTDFSHAVRVRTSDYVKLMGKAPEGEIRLGLQVTAEPKLQLQQLLSVRLEKAVDDQGQKLQQMMNLGPNANPLGGPMVLPPIAPGVRIGFGGAMPPGAGFGGFGGLQGMAFGGVGAPSQYSVFQLKKGEKPAKTLKEVSGVITAQVLTPPQPAITVDNIMKMAGKEVKGKDGGRIKVTEVTKADNGRFQVRFEFEEPGNVGNPFGGQGGFFPGGARGGLQIQPIPPVPPQGKALPQKPVQGGKVVAQQVQIQLAKPAQLVPIQIQIGPGGAGGAGFIGMPVAGNTGFALVDDKGNTLQANSFNQQFRQVGNVIKMEYVLTFQVEKGREPGKLVYSVCKSATIDIPFTLKDMAIP
jgi:hypothetical protein